MLTYFTAQKSRLTFENLKKYRAQKSYGSTLSLFLLLLLLVLLGLEVCLSMVSNVTSRVVGVGVSKHSVDELVREKSYPRGR